MIKEKIRISLYSFNKKLLNEACNKIFNLLPTLESKNNIKGPIFIPTKRRIYCVLRSPHVDKDSREQFEIRRYKRIIDIYPESSQTFEAFLKLELASGVLIKVNIYSEADAKV
jgi:small subunit ribosomal protein S10